MDETQTTLVETEMQWDPPADGYRLEAEEVHVWAVSLDMPEQARTAFEPLLSGDEKARAARFRFDEHRRRFICGRAALRFLLGKYLESKPDSLLFRYGPGGKPSLADSVRNAVSFNVAHSEDFALIAIAARGEIGVDVERVRWLPHLDDLVSRFFAESEAGSFRGLDPELKSTAFFNLWTRKEALLKATGDGIVGALNRVEVTFLPGQPARLLALPEEIAPAEWTLRDIARPQGFAAALAINQKQFRVKCRRFVPEIPEPAIPRFCFPGMGRLNVGRPLTTPLARPPVSILGVRFDNVTILETLDTIEKMIAIRRPHYCVTANVDFVVKAQTDVELRRIFFDADLVLCDGTPLVWASRLLGNPLRERVAGADVVPLLIELAEKKKYRVFFLGAAPESIDRAVANVQARHPGLVVCGHYSPPFNPLLEMEHEEIRRRVVEARPDLLFVSLGCPKQEKWVAMNYRAMGVPVTIGVGATIDFLAGQMRRAPRWMHRAGLEWTYRLLQEPRRLYARYSKDIRVFGTRISSQIWRMRKSGEAALINGGEETAVPIPRIFDARAAARMSAALNEMALARGDKMLDLSRVEYIDSTGVAALMLLQRRVASNGRHLILLSPGRAVRNALAFMRLETFFDLVDDLDQAKELLERRARESRQKVATDPGGTFRALIWHGEITAPYAEEVWQRTRRYVEEAQSVLLPEDLPEGSTLVVDLSVVPFMDSSGLALMLRVREFAALRGFEIRFANVQPAVRNVIQMADIEEPLLGRGRTRRRGIFKPRPSRTSAGEPLVRCLSS